MKLHTALLLFSGLAAAVQWQPEVRLTANNYSDFSYWSTQRRVVVDQERRVHVAWHVMNSGLGTHRFQIYYKRWLPGTGWTADTMVSADLYAAGKYCKYVSLAVDSSGVVHAVWGAGSSDAADEAVYTKTCTPTGGGNGGWDPTSRMLSTSAATHEKGCPTVSATPDGHVHATWLELALGAGSYIVYRERIDTVWQAERHLEAGANYKAYPAIAAAPGNDLHLVWYGREGPSGYYNVFYKARIDTTWGATENVSNGIRHQMYPSIAVNPVGGAPHVFWQCYDAVSNKRRAVHRWRSAAGWQATDTLSEPGDTLNQETGQIIFTVDGRGYALWSGRSPSSPTMVQIRYCERSPAGSWSSPANLTDTSGSKERPSPAAGGGASPNDVHVVWTDYRDGNAEMYYCHGEPTQGVAESRVPVSSGRYPTFLLPGQLLPVAGAAVLIDASGRQVMRLRPGGNDVSDLTAGVYYVAARGVCRARVVIVALE